MTHVEQMLQSHPGQPQADAALLANAISTVFECAQTCTACADACLSEEQVASLRHCIRTDLDCADVCMTTGTLLTRQTAPDLTLVRAQLQACVVACGICAAECEQHAGHHEHCRICGETCRRCEDVCNQVLAHLAA